MSSRLQLTLGDMWAIFLITIYNDVCSFRPVRRRETESNEQTDVGWKLLLRLRGTCCPQTSTSEETQSKRELTLGWGKTSSRLRGVKRLSRLKWHGGAERNPLKVETKDSRVPFGFQRTLAFVGFAGNDGRRSTGEKERIKDINYWYLRKTIDENDGGWLDLDVHSFFPLGMLRVSKILST